jgi:hypothetical protein
LLQHAPTADAPRRDVRAATMHTGNDSGEPPPPQRARLPPAVPRR